VIAELVEDAEVRAGRRKHDVSVLRAGDAFACGGRLVPRPGIPADGDLALDPRER
jgi:hypothetical protein